MNTICTNCTGETVENGVCRNCGFVESAPVVILNEDATEQKFEVAEEPATTEELSV